MVIEIGLIVWAIYFNIIKYKKLIKKTKFNYKKIYILNIYNKKKCEKQFVKKEKQKLYIQLYKTFYWNT